MKNILKNKIALVLLVAFIVCVINVFFVMNKSDNDKDLPLENIDVDVVSEYNAFDIDYNNLDVEAEDGELRNVNLFVSQRKASKKNEYTGIFKGKNLILICAEAYSQYFVDEKLTPTLYRLTNSGFKLNNYYVPSFGGGTISGEYAFLTGLIPVDVTQCMKDTVSNNMCFTLARVLKEEGYITGAYYSDNYKQNDRNIIYKENLGFDKYLADFNGLEKVVKSKPINQELLKDTFETYSEDDPFCMYYMIRCGSTFYNDSSALEIKKNIERVEDAIGDKYPEQVLNYICHQLYLEDSLANLVSELDKKHMLDNTVICLTADHYPYGLNNKIFDDGINYLPYLYGKEEFDYFDEDRSMPIIWSGSLENKYKGLSKEINEPTSSIDLLPTILNLFGVNFDSRLIAGRDIFSDAEAIVMYNDGSYITKRGKYVSKRKKFFANDGEDVDKEYIDKYIDYTNGLILYSEYVNKVDYYDYIFSNKNVKEEIKNNISLVGIDIPVELKDKTFDSYVKYFKQCNRLHLNSKKDGASDKEKQKTVYLTFDDGPNKYCDNILEALDRNDVKATFFIVGTKEQKEVKELKDRGHTVGLHSASHEYAYIYESKENFLTDLYKIQNFVYNTTGEYSHYIRFPAGSKNRIGGTISKGIMAELRPLVEELGFEFYDWHIATGDSSENTSKEHILSSVERCLRNNYDEVIILMHDLHSITVESLDDVIKLCREYGYTFDKISDDTMPFHAIEDDYN